MKKAMEIYIQCDCSGDHMSASHLSKVSREQYKIQYPNQRWNTNTVPALALPSDRLIYCWKKTVLMTRLKTVLFCHLEISNTHNKDSMFMFMEIQELPKKPHLHVYKNGLIRLMIIKNDHIKLFKKPTFLSVQEILFLCSLTC